MRSAESLITLEHRPARRFGIAWRNRVNRSIHDVAVLDARADYFRFQYLPGVAESADGFRPFIGFPAIDRVYESDRLWPFFALRVMDRKRPDFAQWVQWLGLRLDADQLDILSRSGGEQKGDTVSMAEAPSIGVDGSTHATFVVRGSSYANKAYDSAPIVGQVAPGDHLDVIEDTTNVANPDALLLGASGTPIGWVPDLLIDYVRHIRPGGATVTVVRNNGPQAPWHLRLIAQVSGIATPGWSAFAGGRWPDMSSLDHG